METSDINNSIPPELFLFSGEWEPYQEALFEIFKTTIAQGNLTFLGLPVKTRWFPSLKGKDFTFWHLISEGEKEEDRVPDLRRCERLSWVGWVLNNYATHPSISFCENNRKSSKNYVIWYKEGNYVVILSKRGKYFLLKTAYHVTSSHRIKSLQADMDAYKKNGS